MTSFLSPAIGEFKLRKENFCGVFLLQALLKSRPPQNTVIHAKASFFRAFDINGIFFIAKKMKNIRILLKCIFFIKKFSYFLGVP